MGVESASWVTQLDATNPVVGDPVGEGDDHLRMIKTVLKNSFPSSSTSAIVPNVSGNQNKLLSTDGTDNVWTSNVVNAELKNYSETTNVIGSIGGGTQDLDLSLGNVFSATVNTSATTFTFSNPPASGTAGSFTLILTNGGSQTVTWPASAKWGGGTSPTLTAAGVDVLAFITVDGGTNWYGFAHTNMS
jgi:hypothetical protein